MSVKSNKLCTGCGLCAYICQHKAIQMLDSRSGFLTPVVDEKKCVECGKCARMCPVYLHQTNLPLNAYAVQNSNLITLSNSTSGGAFSLISDYVLENNGVVFATTHTKDHAVICVKAENTKERDEQRGTIYAQSRIDGVFQDIEDSVLKRKTLFVGTPCQVAAVKNLFQRIPDSLITVDLFCHGVMSPKLLSDFIYQIECESNRRLIRFSFRDKAYGWMAATQSALFADGKKRFSFEYATIKHIYQSGNAMRDCCYDCPYACASRIGDISIGDMWDLKKYGIENDNRGFSCVLINTERGKACCDYFPQRTKAIAIDPRQLSQQALTMNITGKDKAKSFYIDYCTEGFEVIKQHYGRISCRERVSMILHRTVHAFGADKLILRLLGK